MTDRGTPMRTERAGLSGDMPTGPTTVIAAAAETPWSAPRAYPGLRAHMLR